MGEHHGVGVCLCRTHAAELHTFCCVAWAQGNGHSILPLEPLISYKQRS